MNSVRSTDVPTASGSGSQKLGHPVPLSYFVVGSEQRLAAAGARECADALFRVERAAERPLGGVPAQHPVRLGLERRAPLVVGLFYGEMATGHVGRRGVVRAFEPGDDRYKAQRDSGDGQELPAILHVPPMVAFAVMLMRYCGWVSGEQLP